MNILANEFVLPMDPALQCHASHLLPLPDGSVYCVCFRGSSEGEGDVRIAGALRDADGCWSEPVFLSEDDGLPHWNPVLFRREDGSILLFYKVGWEIPHWVTRCRISRDNCRSWEPSFELVPGDTSGGRGPVRNKPISLPDGSILAPGSTEQGEWKCFFDLSRDNGQTWQRSADVTLGALLPEDPAARARRGIIQPTLWRSPSGIHALMRSTEGHIFRTYSDDGVSWSQPRPISLPNNNSGIDLAALPDGRILLACNPVTGRRTPMSLYLSEDDGEHFRLLTHLCTQSYGEYSYPAVQYAGGKLHISYTWRRQNIVYLCLEV